MKTQQSKVNDTGVIEFNVKSEVELARQEKEILRETMFVESMVDRVEFLLAKYQVGLSEIIDMKANEPTKTIHRSKLALKQTLIQIEKLIPVLKSATSTI